MIRARSVRFVAVALLAVPAPALCQASRSAPASDGTVSAAFEDVRTAPPATKDDGPGLGEVFSSLKGDFTRLALPGNLTLLAVGASSALSVHRWDDNVAESGWGRGTAHEVFEPGKTAGGALAQVGGAFATYFAGRLINQPKLTALGADLVRAQLVSQTVTQSIKFTATRTRPDGTSLSFPSGHTSSAFATATVLQSNYGWKVGVPAYAAAAWIGASRVQMNRHFVSDVIAGATIGIVAGRSVTFGRGEARFAVSPAAGPGSFGVTVTKVSSR